VECSVVEEDAIVDATKTNWMPSEVLSERKRKEKRRKKNSFGWGITDEPITKRATKTPNDRHQFYAPNIDQIVLFFSC